MMANTSTQPKKDSSDLAYWSHFVETFFSPIGVLRHCVLIVDQDTSKQYEIPFPALARYFYTHFESGVCSMQMMVERAVEHRLPNDQSFIASEKTSFIYGFENGSQVCQATACPWLY